MGYLRKLTLLLLALVATAAQDQTDLGGSLEDVGELDGVEPAVSRSWTIDVEALLAQSPEPASTGDPLAGLEGTIFLTGPVMQFEGSGEAGAAFERYRDTLPGEIAGYENEEELISEGEIDDRGNNAHGFDIYRTADDTEGYFRYLMVQQDAYFFVVITAATGEDATSRADSLAKYLVEGGKASGGAWGFFPENDHKGLDGIVAADDDMLYPVPDSDR